jgi:hypothetical protein
MPVAYDRRESILARLVEIAATVPGVVTAVRNQDEVSEGKRPAVIILDADEQVADPPGRSNHAGNAGTLVTMTPEIYLMLGASPDDVGSSINEFRAAFLGVVLGDTGLAGIVGSNGSVAYQGCGTGFGRGRNMEATMAVSIAFTYPLFPSRDLALT